jgi:hypothetical protein
MAREFGRFRSGVFDPGGIYGQRQRAGRYAGSGSEKRWKNVEIVRPLNAGRNEYNLGSSGGLHHYYSSPHAHP